MSITHRVLRRCSTLALSTLALALALTTSAAPATANGLDDIDPSELEWATFPLVCDIDELDLTINPATGDTMFRYQRANGSVEQVISNEIAVTFDGRPSIDLEVRFWYSEGILEVSPDGEDTTTTATHRSRVTVNMEPDPAGGAKDYLLVFLDPDGQELPSLPTVKVKTKPSCPISPMDPGFEDE